MLQLNLSDQHFYCLIRCAYIRGLVVVKDCFYRCLKMTPTLSPVKCLNFRSLVQRMYGTHCYVHAHEVYKQSQCCCQKSYICLPWMMWALHDFEQPFSAIVWWLVNHCEYQFTTAVRSASANEISFYKNKNSEPHRSSFSIHVRRCRKRWTQSKR